MDFKKESDLSTIYGKCVSGIQRTCANCNTSKSPAWRGGPAGPKSLCNACGIRYKRRKGILGLRNREEDKKDRRKNKLAISSKKRLLAMERFVLLQRSLLQNHESCSKLVLSKINDECSGPENQLNGVQKRCADCNTTKTPEWRCGPAGPRSLCNACGIRYRKRGRDVLGLNNGELDNKERRKSWGGISYKMRLLTLERYALSQRSLIQTHESCSKSNISTVDGTCSGLESHFNGIQSCSDCKTTKTPRWRVGPAGPKSLCNACGIKYRRRRRDVVGLNEREGDKKERRKNKVGVSYKMRSLALERYVLSQRSPLQTHDICSKSDISTVDGKCSIPENLFTEIKRSCANCNATKTPVWRGGPAGPQSLCNACGIRYRKRRRVILGLNIREEDKKERSKNRLQVPYKISPLFLKRYVPFQRSPQKDESRTKSDISTIDHNCSGPESQSSGNQRSCADCNTTKTPVWRGGPTGPKSLCNACGIRYRKRRGKQTKLEEEEQAAAQLMALSFGSVQA